MSRHVKLGLDTMVANCNETSKQASGSILSLKNESVDSGGEWRGSGCARMMAGAGVVQICGELEIDDRGEVDDRKSREKPTISRSPALD